MAFRKNTFNAVWLSIFSLKDVFALIWNILELVSMKSIETFDYEFK